MSKYSVVNLSYETPKVEQLKLETALKRIQGVRSVLLSLARKEFSLTCTGMEPNIHVLKEACSGAGFQLSRKI